LLWSAVIAVCNVSAGDMLKGAALGLVLGAVFKVLETPNLGQNIKTTLADETGGVKIGDEGSSVSVT